MRPGTILDHRGAIATRRSTALAPTRSAYYASGYSGADFSTARSLVPGWNTDSSRELDTWTRTELMRKSRWLKKNIGLVRGVAKSIVEVAIGPGIYPMPNTADDTWNEAAWNWFWLVSQTADASGRMTFFELQRMRTLHKFYDGDCFTTLARDPATGYPRFQFFRAHRCDNYDVDEADGWISGIRLGPQRQPLAYRLSLGDDRYKTLPAASVTHSYMLEDGDQVRGVTALAHAINDSHDIFDTLGLTKETVKDIARRGHYIKTESGEVEDDDDGDGFLNGGNSGRTTNADPDGLPLQAIFGGAEIRRLRIGESVEQVKDDRPSPAFTGFLDFLGRGITAGSGMPYEWAWDRKGFTSPAIRLVLEQVKSCASAWAENEIKSSIPFYTYATSIGIDLGILRPRPDQYEVEWLRGAPEPTIDRAAASARISELKAAMLTFKRYYASQGLWWKTELRQKGLEAVYIRDTAAALGISEDRIHQLAPNNAGTEPAEETTTTPARSDEEDT